MNPSTVATLYSFSTISHFFVFFICAKKVISLRGDCGTESCIGEVATEFLAIAVENAGRSVSCGRSVDGKLVDLQIPSLIFLLVRIHMAQKCFKNHSLNKMLPIQPLSFNPSRHLTFSQLNVSLKHNKWKQCLSNRILASKKKQ